MTYRVILWHSDFVTLGTAPDFASALAIYAASADHTKALINDATRDTDTSGLSDDEKDAVFSLPVTRAATAQELAVALSMLEAA